MDVFAQIREACRWVAKGANHVHLQPERIAGYAESLVGAGLPAPALDEQAHFTGEEQTTLAYYVTLDTVNFGSGYFPHLDKPEGRSGYFTLAGALAGRFRRQGPLAAEVLQSLDRQGVAEIFRQPPDGGPREELMGLFTRALNDLGAFLLTRFSGSFAGLVEEAGCEAGRLIQILEAMPLFRDVHVYRGREVPLYKRAQILAADLSLAFTGRGPGCFHDLDRLTLFADNLVPHVLRLDGILVFAKDLADRIERQEPIPSGSEEEVEIRACALHAVEGIVAEARRAGEPGANAMRIDGLLWNRGQGRTYKARPRHRTRCVHY